MFLVTGITGKTGSATARHLLRQGKRVRALVRDRSRAAAWAEYGVELVSGDLVDPTSLREALDGTEGAFVMLPTSFMPSRDLREVRSFVAAYREVLPTANLARLVLLSSLGADKTSGTGLTLQAALLERELGSLRYPHAILRPATFLNNYHYGKITGKSGILPLLFAELDGKYPMVASEDVGAAAAQILAGPSWEGRRIVEIGSLVSPRELAAELSIALSRPVRAELVPRDQWSTALMRIDYADGTTWATEETYEAFNSHHIGFGAPGAERIEGTTPAREVFADILERRQRA